MKLMNNIDKEEKKLIRKMFWRSGAMYASVNPVTMGGAGFCYAMIPFINHFYKNDEKKRREALARHVSYFSTTVPMASASKSGFSLFSFSIEPAIPITNDAIGTVVLK